MQDNDDDTREPIDTEKSEAGFPDARTKPVQDSSEQNHSRLPSRHSHLRRVFEPKAACWASDLPSQIIENALASCDTASCLKDDVINTALGLLCSLHPRLRTLSSPEMARPEALRLAINRILPPYGGARENAAKTPTANRLIGESLLDVLVLIVGFQPVLSHWVLVWIAMDARTACIYDGRPSEAGRQPAERVVRDLITMLPAPHRKGIRQDGGEGTTGTGSGSGSSSAWKVAFPAFATQTDGYTYGIFALAAAFHLAAG